MQYAAQEVIDERFLQPIFAAVGGHAHNPTGMLANETHGICTPYIAGAGTHSLNAVIGLVVLLCGYYLM